MSYLPSSGVAIFKSASVREVHVGGVASAYATIEEGLAAIAALVPAVSASNPASLVVHTGSYTPAAGAWPIQGGTAVVGAEGATVSFVMGATDLFDIQGDVVLFRNFSSPGGANSALAMFRCNNHNNLHWDHIGLYGGNTKFLVQSGNTWTIMAIGNSLVNSLAGGKVFEFTNTGGPRNVDVEISNSFIDTWEAGAAGGGFNFVNCQDVRFRVCKIRTVAGSSSITVTGAGSWIEISHCMSVKSSSSVGNLYNGGAGTTCRFAYSDGSYVSQGIVNVVGPAAGIPGPPGPASGLTTALDLDLSTLAPAAYSGDGLKTLDGRAAFRYVNSSRAQQCALNDGTHAGLYMRASTASSVNYGSNYNGPRWVVGLKDLCGVDPKAALEQWVFVMFEQPHTPNANYEYAYMGITALPGGDTDSGHTTPVFELARGFSSPSLTTLVEWQKGAVVTQNPAGVSIPTTMHDVYAFRVLANEWVEAYCGLSNAGAWPTIAELNYVGRAAYHNQAQGFAVEAFAVSALFQWALVFSVATSNTLGLSDLLMKKIMVLYR